MIAARARSSASAPALIGAMRSRAAALDEPGHSKTRHAVNLRPPHYKFHPRRLRRSRAQPFGHRAQPPLLGFEALAGLRNRGAAGRYTSRRQKLFLRARHPSRRDRMAHRLARGCWSTHRTLPSRAAKRRRSAAAMRTATPVSPELLQFRRSSGRPRRKSTNLHLGSSSPDAAQGTVITGSVEASATDQSASIRVSSPRAENPAASSPPNSRHNRPPAPGRRNGLHAPSRPAEPGDSPAKRRGSMATS